MFAAPRPKPSVGTPAGRVQDQDQDQDDEQEIVRSPSQPILVIASHPLNGWIWFGEGLRGYDNWQRSAASDFKQNGHENMASPLKLVAATTPKSGAEEKLLEIDLIIPTRPDLKISSNPRVTTGVFDPKIARP